MLIDQVYLGFLQEKQEQEEFKNFYLRPSNIAYCAEKLRRQLKGETLELQPHVILKMRIGELVHEEIQKLLFKYRGRSKYIYKKSEKLVDIEYKTMKLRGSIDFYFLYGEERTPWLADFKVVGKERFSYIESSEDEADSSYLTQLNLYAYGLNIKNILLIYINVDNGEYIEKEYTRDDSFVEKAFQKYEALMNDNKEQIEAFSPCFSWECRYCSFSSSCYLANNKKAFRPGAGTQFLNDEQRKAKALEYFNLKKQVDELSSKMEEIKSQMIQGLDFSKTQRYNIEYVTIARYVREYVNYDKETLERLVDHEILKKAKRIKEVESFRVYINK